MSTSSEEFIAIKRSLLDRLERFVSTPQYQRLHTVIGDAEANLPEAWLLEWLVTPAFGLGGLPIDIAGEPGGVEVLEAHLKRIAHDGS